MSLFDGIGMGLGFTLALTAIGIVREFLGAGTIFGRLILPQSFEPITIFILAPGAFFVAAGITALQNKLKFPSATNVDEDKKDVSCSGNCFTCGKIEDAEDEVAASENKED